MKKAAGIFIALCVVVFCAWAIVAMATRKARSAERTKKSAEISKLAEAVANLNKQVAELQKQLDAKPQTVVRQSPAAPATPQPATVTTNVTIYIAGVNNGGGTIIVVPSNVVNNVCYGLEKIGKTSDGQSGMRAKTPIRVSRPAVEIQDVIKDLRNEIREKQATLGLVRENLRGCDWPSQKVVLRGNIAKLEDQVNDMKDELVKDSTDLQSW